MLSIESRFNRVCVIRTVLDILPACIAEIVDFSFDSDVNFDVTLAGHAAGVVERKALVKWSVNDRRW